MTEGVSSVGPSTDARGVVAIEDYVGALRRGWRVVLAGTIAGAIVGIGLVGLVTGGYTSEVLIQVRPIVSQSDDPNLDTGRFVSPETEEAIATSERVAERALALRQASADLGNPDVAAPDVVAAAQDIIADGSIDPISARASIKLLEVSVAPDSQILALRATAGDPGLARVVAQSTAVAYLEFRRDQATAEGAESRRRLEAREAELVSELEDLTGNIAFVPDTLAFADLASRQELTVIGTKYANLEALTVDPGVILTDAELAPTRDGLPPAAGPLFGVMLGLMAGAGAALLLDRSDDRLRHPRSELAAIGTPLLATTPVEQLYPPDTVGSEAYRRLRGALFAELDRRGTRSVLLVGVDRAGAASAVAANLGVAAARAGRRTLIVEANLRNGAVGRALGLGSGPGLSDVIVDDANPADVVEVANGDENLLVLQAGTRRDRPAEVLQSAGFARLVGAAGTEFDLVVVEAPPVLPVADALDIAGLCDGAVVVADERRASRTEIAEAVDQLRGVGSDVVGVVVARSR